MPKKLRPSCLKTQTLVKLQVYPYLSTLRRKLGQWNVLCATSLSMEKRGAFIQRAFKFSYFVLSLNFWPVFSFPFCFISIRYTMEKELWGRCKNYYWRRQNPLHVYNMNAFQGFVLQLNVFWIYALTFYSAQNELTWDQFVTAQNLFGPRL